MNRRLIPIAPLSEVRDDETNLAIAAYRPSSPGSTNVYLDEDETTVYLVLQDGTIIYIEGYTPTSAEYVRMDGYYQNLQSTGAITPPSESHLTELNLAATTAWASLWADLNADERERLVSVDMMIMCQVACTFASAAGRASAGLASAEPYMPSLFGNDVQQCTVTGIPDSTVSPFFFTQNGPFRFVGPFTATKPATFTDCVIAASTNATVTYSGSDVGVIFTNLILRAPGGV